MQNGKTQDLQKKVAIYIRVSTTFQIDKDSLPMQRKDLTSYSELILGIPDYEIFEDAGYSGKNVDRPAFQEMMERVRDHEFSHVLVWKIDRISRNLLDFSEMYEEFQRLRVTFVSKNEQFDTSTAIGGAILKILLVFAELERNMTSERVTATMISRASRGLWNGGTVPFGYTYDPETHDFSVYEPEADVIRLIKDDYLSHRSVLHVTRTLNSKGITTRNGNEWSAPVVWSTLNNPFYCGKYRYNRYKGDNKDYKKPEKEWVIVDNHHPPIITEEDYNNILASMAHNADMMNHKGYKLNSKYTHPFINVLYCSKCNSRMTTKTSKRKGGGPPYTSYYCMKYKNNRTCDNTSTSENKVGEFVINYILNMINSEKSFAGISNIDDLERALLRGIPFINIESIERSGLIAFYNLLKGYDSDEYVLEIPLPDISATDSKSDELQRDLERQQRALKRLQDLYLFSDDAMPEKDFIVKKNEILDSIAEIEVALSDLENSDTEPDLLSDDEFIRLASHLLISSQLQDSNYINYATLSESVSLEVLRDYVQEIIDKVFLYKGQITEITFKNGLTHKFVWKNNSCVK